MIAREMSRLRIFAALVATAANIGTAAAALTFTPASLDFGANSMKTTSPPLTVTMTNGGAAALTVSALTLPYNNEFIIVAHNCATLAPGASCSATLRFTPSMAGLIQGYLNIASSAGSDGAYLAGTSEQSLSIHYYRSILRREPDAGGKAFWDGEASRLSSIGANLNEAWYAMAMSFYSSAEYQSLNRGTTEFVRDLYATFFDRNPDDSGLAYWSGQLDRGVPRESVLAAFLFSAEFAAFTRAIFGDQPARAEIDTATDFYRGILGRAADSGGFTYWLNQFRIAQCQGAADVNAEADTISAAFLDGAEYAGRRRTNREFVTDLYNSFLRRGADLEGVLFWIGQIDSGAKSRSALRREFISSPEFQARVAGIINAGCVPGVCSYSLSYGSNLTGAGVENLPMAIQLPEKCGWSIYSKTSWIHTDRNAGVGPQVIIFGLDPNPNSTIRTGTMTFLVPGAGNSSGVFIRQFAGLAGPQPPTPPTTDPCLLAGYCRSNGVCCARGWLGCGNLCYPDTGSAYRGGGCTSFSTFCPN